MSPLSASAQRVQDALAGFGCTARVREMPASTRTAADAAAACGCEQGAIVKSMIFGGAGTGQGILVLIPKLSDRNLWQQTPPQPLPFQRRGFTSVKVRRDPLSLKGGGLGWGSAA